MSQHHEYKYQLEKINDHRDQIASSLFQIFKIMATYFPESDLSSINKMNQLLDDDFKEVINKIKENHYRVYN